MPLNSNNKRNLDKLNHIQRNDHKRKYLPTSPYRSNLEYMNLLPNYEIDSMSDIEYSAYVISSLIPQGSRDLLLVDCGAGPGRIWPHLDNRIKRIIAIEPNRKMWAEKYDNRVTYVESDAFSFLINTSTKPDIICWLWSINYNILSFFEYYDASLNKVVIKDWKLANKLVRSEISRAIDNHINSAWYFMIFDSDSVEQKFITSIWQNEAPFPFNNRGYTRKILFDVLNNHFNKERNLTFEHLSANAYYGNLEESLQRMLGFHLRHHFDHKPSVIKEVRNFLSRYEQNKKVIVPAGVYIAKVSNA